MAKFVQKFRGVKAGDVYPTEFQVGDECPKELLAAAESVGAVKKTKAMKKAPETK